LLLFTPVLGVNEAAMTTIRPEISDRAVGEVEPLAVTFRTASQVTGLGATTLWKYAKEGLIRVIHPPGVRRTLIDFASLKKLLAPEKTDTPAPARRGRPRSEPFDISRHLDELAGRSLRKAAP
jgi:hypothetical protein